MLSRTLKTAVLAAAAAGVFAGTAHASIIDTDSVQLQSNGFDFGDDTWSGSNPTGAGEITFDRAAGTITPRLAGTIHLNDEDGLCGRVRLRYFNSSHQQLAEKFGGKVCADDHGHHSWQVDLQPYSSAGIHSVEVAVMKITASDEVVAASAEYTANTFPDAVYIDTNGTDLGSHDWSNGQPTGYAYMSWPLTGASVQPRLSGGITLKGTTGACARVYLRYLDDKGYTLSEQAGGTVCASDKSDHTWTVDLDPYTSDRIDRIDVELQTLAINGDWLTAGTQRVSIAE